MTKVLEKHNIKLENLSVNEFRQRCFVKRSEALYGIENSPYTYLDDLPEQVEAMEGFTNWESFSNTWDVYWVGLDPRVMSWVAGRHNSPIRKLVTPLQLVEKDERTNRLIETYIDRALVQTIPVPNTTFQESEQDRIISESLTGKVVIDEPDEDKAIRMIENNMKILQDQLAILMRGRK
jgi:hypothetical protein